jgi:DNA invertase Pin-like site-specific DNA recombinase
LLEAGVDARFADLPQIEGATGRFLLRQMIAVAELEAGMISARTKAALAAAKKRGKKLGGNRGALPNAKMWKASVKAREAHADARAADLAGTIRELQAAGATSLKAIADGLNQHSYLTRRRRLVRRAGSPRAAADRGLSLQRRSRCYPPVTRASRTHAAMRARPMSSPA